MIYSPESENALIGSLLLDPAEVLSACENRSLRDNHFFVAANRTVFSVVNRMASIQMPVDLATVTETARQQGCLTTIGGPGALATMFLHGGCPANAASYIEIIKAKAKAREIIASCTQLIELASTDHPDLLQTLEATLHALAEDDRHALSIKDQVILAMNRIQDTAEGVLVPGLTTGLPSLDHRIGGVFRGEMLTIKAATGQGKTALGHQMLRANALHQNRPCLLFSFEMASFDVISRLVSAEASIPVGVIRRGKFPPDQFKAFNAVTNKIASSKLQIVDNADLNISAIRSRARTEKRRAQIELVVVDYCQKIRPSRNHNSREREVAEVSDECQKMAMELSLPVILLAQQNEDGAMRESRGIGMDSKVVLALEGDPENDAPIVPFSIIIAKNSHGQVGKISASFNKQFVRFE